MTTKKMRGTDKRTPRAEPISLTVNGEVYELGIGDRPDGIEPHHTLSFTLRETLGLTGTKISCDNGACGPNW